MNVEIIKIKVMARIRKEVKQIDELADSIKKEGLLEPIVVMVTEDGQYQLLAGLRRLKACSLLGYEKINVNVVSVSDAEQALRMEIAENEERQDFTFSEKMDFARLLEDIEKVKAKERMLEGKTILNPMDPGPQGKKGSTRDVVGKKIGLSGRHYNRAKYIVENASPEMIEALDEKKITIRSAYDQLKAKHGHKEEQVEKTENEDIKDSSAVNESNLDKERYLSDTHIKNDDPSTSHMEEDSSHVETSAETVIKKRGDRRIADIKGMSEKVLMNNPIFAKLKADCEAAVREANFVKGTMCDLVEKHKNQIFHAESIQASQRKQIENLQGLLTAANDRIKKLEAELLNYKKEANLGE